MGCDCAKGRKSTEMTKLDDSLERLESLPQETRSASNLLSPATTDKRASKHKMTLLYSDQIRVLREPISVYYSLPEDTQSGEVAALYKATGQLCVIRILSKDDQIVYNRPRSELRKCAKIMTNLDHPNLPRVVEIVEDSSNFYFVTEAATEGPLEDFLWKRKRIGESFARDVIYQVISAVNYCHTRKITHPGLAIGNVWMKNPPTDDSVLIAVTGFNVLFPVKSTLKLDSVYSAPESIRGLRSEKSDVWSCGVMLYFLLMRKLPFEAGKFTSELAKGRRMKAEFWAEDWEGISGDAKKLVYSMLAWDADARPSAKDCLQSPWFQAQQTPSFRSASASLSNLVANADSSALKDAVKAFIIMRVLKPQQLEAIRESFKALDVTGSGQITGEQLQASLKKIMPESKAMQEFERIMSSADRNGNGLLDYSEFLIASFREKELLSKENLTVVFQTIDRDGSGAISLEELRKSFSIEGCGEKADRAWKQLMKVADKSGDGEIDFQEFTQMMIRSTL